VIKSAPQGSKKSKSNGLAATSEDTAHILGIVSSLFSNIPSESPDRIRLLTKFVENNYEKADKLLEVRENAHNRLKIVNAEIEAEKKVRGLYVTDEHPVPNLMHRKRSLGGVRLSQKTRIYFTYADWRADCSRCKRSIISWHGWSWKTMG
jgi:hypothetical protein